MLTALCRTLILASLLAASGAAASDVRLGLANPLSGPYAASGEQNRIAVRLAVETLNQTGGVLGREVRLVIVDDACDVERAAAAALELVKAGVAAVIGHMCSHASLIAAPIYEAAGIPMLTPDSTHPRVTEEGRANVFRLIGRDDEQGRMAAELLARLSPTRPIAIIHDESTYGSGLAWATRDALRRNGVREALFATYMAGTIDYAALIERLVKERIGILYVAGYGPDAGRIVRAAHVLGGDTRYVGGDGLGMPEFWTEAGTAGEGAVFTTRPDLADSPGAASVLAALHTLGVATQSTVLGYYAATQVWAEAVARAGTPDPATVTTALHRGRFASVLGRIGFDEKGDVIGATWQWQVWHDGSYAPLPARLAMGQR
jgi:branched-chain amino acid transport system substrate-binding protein